MNVLANIPKRKMLIGAGVLAFFVILVGTTLYNLEPVGTGTDDPPVVFEVRAGQGFREIIGNLRNRGLVRSSSVAELYALLDGAAFRMQPGLYRVSPAMSTPAIVGALASGSAREVAVTIPEGSNLYDIDRILADALVIRRGELINFHASRPLEGTLFPDTYRFFAGTDVKIVVQKFLDNFNAKAAPLLAADRAHADQDLVIASMIEKEVPDPNDEKLVAGILWKRLRAGMPLDVDAAVCYAIQGKSPLAEPACAPLDLKIDSPYNTYLYKGLPPGPIGNPGITALTAAVHPKSSPYWFYLSDPATGKTIFSQTLDEQHRNTLKYLKGH